MNRSDTELAGDVAEARRVLEADERWVAAFNRGDAGTILSIYAPDVVLMPPDGPDLHGREQVGDWLRDFFDANRARQTLVTAEVRCERDWAYLRGEFELVVTARAGGETTVTRGKHLVIWRRTAGGAWLATRDLWSSGGGQVPFPRESGTG